MQIEVDGTVYGLSLSANVTARSIAEHAPFSIELARYGNEEYQASLPFKPEHGDEATSDVRAGCAYYWEGWNALVLNFENRDISPYKVTPVGEVVGNSSSALRAAGKTVHISLTL